MSTLKITDGVNAVIEVTPNSDSALLKYFKKLPDLSINGAILALRKGLTLDDPAIKTVNAGVNFAEPVDLGTDQVDLKIGAGLNGCLSIFKPEGTNAKLFDPDPYEDPIPVATDSRYVSFGFEADVDSNTSAGVGDLKFGFRAGASVAITNYRLYTTKPSVPELVDAVRTTLEGFVVPGDIEDLQALPVGSVVTLNGAGSLKFSATANLLAAVNPLASAALPAPIPAVALKGGGTISVGVDVQLTGEYQIRLLKLGQQQLRLAYYRKSGTAFSINASASAGISGNVGDTEILGKLMSAISSDAKTDVDEIKKAGLSPDQVRGIENAVKASIARTIEIALTAELATSHTQTAAFVYDVDISSLSAASRAAIHSALDGDLADLTADPSSPLPGIRAIRDLFTNVRERKHSLTINLIGIVNFGWVSRLVLSGKVMYDPATGQLVISDSATASRISTMALNLGVADSEKLRHVMAENFIITVAYRGARAAGLQPSLTTSHSFFALNEHTSQETVRDELDVSVAFGLLSAEGRNQISSSAPEFGRTLFHATTNYDNALSMLLFLDGNQPKPVEFYENAGLQALAYLIHPEDADRARLLPTQDSALWQQMKELGQPNIHTLFPNVPAPVVEAIIADYSIIRWWSDTMHATGKRLADVNGFLSTHPTADDQNNDFKRLRSGLADHLRSVAATTKESFGRPWGLLAMFIASDRRAGRKATLIGRNLSIRGETAIQSAVGSGAGL